MWDNIKFWENIPSVSNLEIISIPYHFHLTPWENINSISNFEKISIPYHFWLNAWDNINSISFLSQNLRQYQFHIISISQLLETMTIEYHIALFKGILMKQVIMPARQDHDEIPNNKKLLISCRTFECKNWNEDM